MFLTRSILLQVFTAVFLLASVGWLFQSAFSKDVCPLPPPLSVSYDALQPIRGAPSYMSRACVQVVHQVVQTFDNSGAAFYWLICLQSGLVDEFLPFREHREGTAVGLYISKAVRT